MSHLIFPWQTSFYLSPFFVPGKEYILCYSNTQVLEHVHVVVDISSRNKRGEFEIRLFSPSGTESKLLALRPLDNSISGLCCILTPLLSNININPSTTGFSNFRTWPLMSTHYWGEHPKGRWLSSSSSVSLTIRFLPIIKPCLFSQLESRSAKLWRQNSLCSQLANRPVRHHREPQPRSRRVFLRKWKWQGGWKLNEAWKEKLKDAPAFQSQSTKGKSSSTTLRRIIKASIMCHMTKHIIVHGCVKSPWMTLRPGAKPPHSRLTLLIESFVCQ